MSHEVAHALARHGGERMSQETGLKTIGSVVGYAMKGRSDLSRDLVLRAYGAGTQFGVVLPHSRKHELEADRIGVMLMAKAGYDPGEAPRFWSRFGSAANQASPPEWMSTHPSDSRVLKSCLPCFPKRNQTTKKPKAELVLAKYSTARDCLAKQKTAAGFPTAVSNFQVGNDSRLLEQVSRDRFAPVLRSQSTPSTEWALGDAGWVVEHRWLGVDVSSVNRIGDELNRSITHQNMNATRMVAGSREQAPIPIVWRSKWDTARAVWRKNCAEAGEVHATVSPTCSSPRIDYVGVQIQTVANQVLNSSRATNVAWVWTVVGCPTLNLWSSVVGTVSDIKMVFDKPSAASRKPR